MQSISPILVLFSGLGFSGFGLGGKPTNDPNKNPFGSVPSTATSTTGMLSFCYQFLAIIMFLVYSRPVQARLCCSVGKMIPEFLPIFLRKSNHVVEFPFF